MSAISYTAHVLNCDAPGCRASFRGDVITSRARLRKRAARTGWTHVRSVSGPRHDDDYCPKHPPAEPEMAATMAGEADR